MHAQLDATRHSPSSSFYSFGSLSLSAMFVSDLDLLVALHISFVQIE